MLENLLVVAVNASLKAGKAILDIYKNENFETELKADNSPLTIADKNAHSAIIKVLDTTHIPVLSEEGRNISYEERKNWDYLWIVDPLDGTKEFINRNGDFTVNIALVKNHEPIIGVVYVPVSEQIYFSIKGNGAYTTKISVDEIFSIDYKSYTKIPNIANRNSLIAVASRSHMNVETKDYLKKLETEKGKIELLSRGSALKICMVAEGEADIYPRFGPTMEWDTAAGHAVAIEAGCTFTQIDEKSPFTYNKENLLNPYFIVKRDRSN